MRINYTFILFLLLATACSKPAAEEDLPVKAKVSVEVTGLTKGVVKDELILFATTLYLKRNVVTATIPAFITQVSVKLGQSVKEGQVLYILETKERRALGEQTLSMDSISGSFGRINVVAPASGIISTLDKQQIGDYVLEGSQLCTIAESSALAFAVNVPYEFIAFTKSNAACSLLLPDDSRHEARFTTPLTTMNPIAQTQTILAKSDEHLFLPENLIVKVLVNKSAEVKQQILPKVAVLTDEMMKKFWVMKLLNDSTAIKVEIIPGVRNNDVIEVKEPLFKESDQFLISGNYGLPDTAFVKVIH